MNENETHFDVDGIRYEISPNGQTASVAHNPDEYCGHVNIPDKVSLDGKTWSVTSINGKAFDECTGLRSVNIPASVTAIGSSAFEFCSGLASFNISDSVTRLGDKAFYGCTGLTGVTCLATEPPEISNDAFDDNSCRNATLRVPAQAVTLYKSNPVWNRFKNIIGIDD